MNPPTAPRFGIWAPHYGYFGSHLHPLDPPDPSYRNNRDIAIAADQLGFESILIAQQTVSTRVADAEVLEPWTAAAAIAEATRNIEIIAAIKPYLYNPGVLAKQALGIDHISAGRFAINVVNGWFVPEMRKLGIPIRDHDERYEYGAAWLAVVRRLLVGQTVTERGRYFDIDGLLLRPGPVRPGGPRVYIGGESEPARRLAAAQADVFVLNGRDIGSTAQLISDVTRRPRGGRAPLTFASAAFVIARETTQEARAEFDYLLDLVDRQDTTHLTSGTDSAVAMMKVDAGARVVGTNGGTNAGLVGSYDEVASRIAEFHSVGVDLFLLQFQPIQAEMARFAEHVIPRVHAAVERPAISRDTR